jgi:hypothetical protein
VNLGTAGLGAENLSRFYHASATPAGKSQSDTPYVLPQVAENNWRKRVGVEPTGDIKDAAQRF